MKDPSFESRQPLWIRKPYKPHPPPKMVVSPSSSVNVGLEETDSGAVMVDGAMGGATAEVMMELEEVNLDEQDDFAAGLKVRGQFI